ncbi:MAG TPA: hypothetical protein DCE55_28585 [Planctomycetaceae bacterium]|nr:hypothetical protein [Planctomycetaceae bacterium]
MGQVLLQGVGQTFLAFPTRYYRQFRAAAPRADDGSMSVSGDDIWAGVARHPKPTTSPAAGVGREPRRCGPVNQVK